MPKPRHARLASIWRPIRLRRACPAAFRQAVQELLEFQSSIELHRQRGPRVRRRCETCHVENNHAASFRQKHPELVVLLKVLCFGFLIMVKLRGEPQLKP